MRERRGFAVASAILVRGGVRPRGDVTVRFGAGGVGRSRGKMSSADAARFGDRGMTLQIDYQSQSFPRGYGLNHYGILSTSWDELLWAAITIGRPSTYHVFRHGPASFHEAIFRLSLVRMAV